MTIPYETNIDTVALQLDFDDTLKQRNKLQLLISWIRGRGLGNLKEVHSNQNIIKYELFYGNTKLLSMHTGSTRIRCKVTGKFKSLYYIRIRFAGLKSYNLTFDNVSRNCLMTICAFLNTTGSMYRFAELDIAIDVFCSFDNVLVSCTRKASNVPYNSLGFRQYFNRVPTSYIENYRDFRQRKDAMLRSYLYDKTAKNKLPFSVTRFELKLQNRFFLNNGFNLSSITNAFSKYHVMYFRNRRDKYYMINKYNNYKNITSRERAKLGFENYRLYPDLTIIEKFIEEIESVYVDFYSNVVLPNNSYKKI